MHGPPLASDVNSDLTRTLRVVDAGNKTNAQRRRSGERPPGDCAESEPLPGSDVPGENAAHLACAVVESASEAMVVARPDGVINGWNAEAERLYGYSAAEAIGRPLEFYASPEQAIDVPELLRSIAGGERVLHYDKRRARKSGIPFDAHIEIFGVRDAKDNLIGIASIHRDMAEQRSAVLALREAETELRARLEQQSAIAELGQRAFRTTEVSPLLDEVAASVARTLGVEFCEVLELQPGGQSLLLRAGIGWNDGLVGRARIAAALDSQAGYTLSTLEPVIVEELGSENRFNASRLLLDHGVASGVSTIIGNPERPYGVLGAHSRSKRRFGRDDINFMQATANIVAAVVERLASEKALHQAQAYTRGLIEASVDGILVIDRDLVISDVNEQMSKLTELPKSMLVGSRFDACFTDPALAEAVVRKTLSEGMVTNYDLTLRAASGKDLLVSLNASIFYDAAGNACGVFASARDVTEQRRIERELREQQSYSRALLEASLDALLVVDSELRITDVNDQTVSFTGYPREELISVPFPSLFTEPERDGAAVRAALAQGFVKDYGLTMRSARGLGCRSRLTPRFTRTPPAR
jgi:PAS domain S-box-containing protein